MSIYRSLFLLALACFLCALGGCAAAPPAGGRVQSDVRSGTDDYDGWLFNSVTGRRNAAASQTNPQTAPQSTPQTMPQTAAPNGVQQASATTGLDQPVGPLVPGPSSPAGPPPTIPAELPPPPAGAISVSSIKLKEDEKKGFELSDLAPENVWDNLKKATGYGPDEKIARTAMKDGQALFREKKYKEAGAKFATAAGRWPHTPLEEDALFLEGESEFFSDQYSKAHDTMGGLLKEYPNTRHLDTVIARQFALGRYWEQAYHANPTWPVTPNLTDKGRPMFDTFGYAVQAYERIRMYDPKGPWADASLMALGNAYFLRGQWEDAAYNYDLLCKEYPNSKYQLKAHLFAIQADMRKYQGSAYDDTPLKEAAKLANATLTQFGDQLGDERQRVVKEAAQIEEEKANRDFVRAQYYQGRHCYGAARFYYKCVVDKFPNSEAAKKSLAQMEAIRNEPDEPPGLFRSLFGGKK